MPIRPENKHRYPKDWKQIRDRILNRAKGKCERCGAMNYLPHPETGSKVVLTIAHINHTPEDCCDENLLALCQLCHNRHDAKTRQAGMKERKENESGQGRLFPR